MTENGKQLVTNRALQRMHNALRILANRRMAIVGSDLKVARLLRLLAPISEPLEATKRADALAIVDQLPEGSVLSPLQEQVLAMRIAQAQETVDVLTVELVIPESLRLTQADLPKELAGKEGAANASGLGALIADLGPLYVLDEEE